MSRNKGMANRREVFKDLKQQGKLELARHNLTPAEVRKALIQHVRNGGEVKQIKEVRETWKDRRDYWYKAIVPMPDLFSKFCSPKWC